MSPQVHRKARADAPAGFFACEAAGLRWLRSAAAVPVVEVLDVADDHLDLVRLTAVGATAEAARDLGRGLALLHDAGADAFGASPDGWHGDGFFGPLDHPLPMAAGRHTSWGAFLAERRLEPLSAALRAAAVVGTSTLDDLHRVEDLLHSGVLDDDDTPARLHGDLWSGNVVWTSQGATLVDPAAHGGHRETDLAMLALFGLPHLDVVLDAYQQVHPLRRGWQHRRGVHQLYPVGVHALLFGGGYVHRLRELAASWAQRGPELRR